MVRCNAGCVPSPELFSKIYAVMPRSEKEKYLELFRTAPKPKKGDDSGLMIMIFVIICCVVLSIAAAGTVYYFDDSIAQMLGYKDAKDMFGTGST